MIYVYDFPPRQRRLVLTTATVADTSSLSLSIPSDLYEALVTLITDYGEVRGKQMIAQAVRRVVPLPIMPGEEVFHA